MPIHRASTLKPYILEQMEMGAVRSVEGVVSGGAQGPRLRLTITALVFPTRRSAAGSGIPPCGHRHPDALHPQI
jgi:hypothetical protein